VQVTSYAYLVDLIRSSGSVESCIPPPTLLLSIELDSFLLIRHHIDILASWLLNNDISDPMVSTTYASDDGTPNAPPAKSYTLMKLSGFSFITACIFYVIASIRGLPSINDENAWMLSAIGALGFVVCGLIEFCNEMGTFHVFLILAGIFGVIAEVLDGYKQPSSVHFNFLSNHMFLLESIKIFIQHKSFFETKMVWITALLIADFSFFFGATIDTVLAWIYILDIAKQQGVGETLSVTRNPTQKNSELVSSVFWLISSILTTAVYMRMGKQIVKNQKAQTNLSNQNAEMA
jgi:hypothetical protein